MSLHEISQGVSSSRESIQTGIIQAMVAMAELKESLATLEGIRQGTGAAEMSQASNLTAEAIGQQGSWAMNLQTFPGIINPWLSRIYAEPIGQISVPEVKDVPPVDPNKYKLEPEGQPEPRKNGMLSDESYDAFGVRVVDLDDPNVLYIEVDGGQVSGEITTDENGVTVATVDLVSVQSGRNEGKGKYLMDAFAREAALRGATQLDSIFSNPIAMRNHIRTYGVDKLQPQRPHAGLDKNSPDYADKLVEGTGEAIDVRVDLTDPEVRQRLFNK